MAEVVVEPPYIETVAKSAATTVEEYLGEPAPERAAAPVDDYIALYEASRLG